MGHSVSSAKERKKGTEQLHVVEKREEKYRRVRDKVNDNAGTE